MRPGLVPAAVPVGVAADVAVVDVAAGAAAAGAAGNAAADVAVNAVAVAAVAAADVATNLRLCTHLGDFRLNQRCPGVC